MEETKSEAGNRKSKVKKKVKVKRKNTLKRLKTNKHHQLKASTLVESLIAMIIMVVCLGIGTMIYTNVMDSDKQRNELKAILLVNTEFFKLKTEKIFLDEEKQIGDWTIIRKVEKYDQAENLYKLSVSVIDRNKKVIVLRNELIPVE